MKSFFSSLIPHFVAVGLFFLLTFAYLTPAFTGKTVKQNDIAGHIGTANELREHREKYDEEALWTNSLFGGMPAFQISVIYSGNLLQKVDKVIKLGLRGYVGSFFLYFLGFYLLLLAFKVNPWLSIVGAIAFGLSSYFIVIIEAGHNSKAHAIAYMAPVIAGVILTYRGKYLIGGIITCFALALEFMTNHLQITYYLFLILMVLCIVEFIYAIKSKELKKFFISSSILLGALVFSIGPNIASLWSTLEYSKSTIRGKSDLAFDKTNKNSGLDTEYATSWSYGKAETLTFLIPNFVGGSSHYKLDEKSETYKSLRKRAGKSDAKNFIQHAPMYHGPQTFTSGSVYVGAIVVFLFVLGIFIVKGKHKWWILFATILSILLAWGQYFPSFTAFMLEYFPIYNKFRAVSMTLVMAELTIPLLGILAIVKILSDKFRKEDLTISISSFKINAFLLSLIITAGTIVLVLLMSGSINYDAPSDSQLGWLADSIKADRKSLLVNDSLRSLFFIGCAALAIYFYINNKLKKNYVIIVIGLLIFADLWMVDKRYLHNEKNRREYVKWEKRKDYDTYIPKNNIDNQILQDQDKHYRVANFSARFDQDSRTCFHHKNLGGYHGAKLKRIQQLIDYQIYNGNSAVLDMFNTKYIINKNPNSGDLGYFPNHKSLGNAWFVEDFKVVDNADEELLSLNSPENVKELVKTRTEITTLRSVSDSIMKSSDSKSDESQAILDSVNKIVYKLEGEVRSQTSFDPSKLAIIGKDMELYIKDFAFSKDSVSSIELVDYKANELTYKSKTSSEQLAVFSEVYYQPGWNAYINDELVPHFRVNFILRAMRVPDGENTIVFKFEPKSYYVGNKVSLATSFILILVFLGMVGKLIRDKIKSEEVN